MQQQVCIEFSTQWPSYMDIFKMLKALYRTVVSITVIDYFVILDTNLNLLYMNIVFDEILIDEGKLFELLSGIGIAILVTSSRNAETITVITIWIV